MEKTVPTEMPADEAAQVQAEIQRYFAEIERANQRMKKDQEEILNLKTRTRAMLAELMAMKAA